MLLMTLIVAKIMFLAQSIKASTKRHVPGNSDNTGVTRTETIHAFLNF